MSVQWVVHDVLQKSGFTVGQKRRGARSTNIMFDEFKRSMRQFEDDEVTLLCLAEGVDNVEWVEYIKAHDKWRVQCHGMRHVRHDLMKPSVMYEQLQQARVILQKTFNTEITEFYCPYNKYSDVTEAVASSLNMKETRGFRRPTHYKHGWKRCKRMDFHYWNPTDMHWCRLVKNLLEPKPIFIVGAPRSGTTAYMRWLGGRTPGAMMLKEREHIWKPEFDRRLYYAKSLADNGLDVIVDKNCRNSYRIESILSEFPDVKFHHVVRDGRAVALSWMKWAAKTNKQDQRLATAARQWVEYVEEILQHLPPDAVTVYYEDLCDREEYFKNCNFKWHKELTKTQVAQIEEIQHPLLTKLGYK